MKEDAADRTTWSELLTWEHLPALTVVCLGVWLHAADILLVSTMMPAIVAEIGGAPLIPWSFALYEIGSIVAGASSGLLSIRLGIRASMTGAALVFATGCLISALAPEMWVLLAGRLLQGFGGGGLVALSFVATSLIFPNRLTARVMAAISLLWGTSAFLGPLIGGLFVTYGTWRGGFWFFVAQSVGLALLTVTMATRVPRVGSRPAGAGFPGVRLACLAAAVFLIALSSVEVEPLRTTVLFALGTLCLICFLRLDARSGDRRLLPRRPSGMTLDRVTAGLLMIFCFAAAAIAITIYGPILMTSLYGTSPLVAGYVIACSSIGWSVAAVAIAGTPEHRDRPMILAGMLVLLASMIGFLYAVPNGPVWLIALFALLEGAGFGMAWALILRRARTLAGPEDLERVAGAIPTVHRLGYAVGAACIGLVANATGLGASLDEATARVAGIAIFLASLPIGLLGLMAALRFLGTEPSSPR